MYQYGEANVMHFLFDLLRIKGLYMFRALLIEGKIKGEMEVTRRRKKLLDDLKDRRGYCHLKGEALDRTVWRNRFGRGFGPVVRQNTEL
jgi:hypothetical protein